LINSYSTSNDECYPNTINDAISLLSTFANQGKDNNTDEAMVSYHEASSDTNHIDDSSYNVQYKLIKRNVDNGSLNKDKKVWLNLVIWGTSYGDIHGWQADFRNVT
jgi:hypothetical protein